MKDIQIHELRIGNIVEFQQRIFKVIDIRFALNIEKYLITIEDIINKSQIMINPLSLYPVPATTDNLNTCHLDNFIVTRDFEIEYSFTLNRLKINDKRTLSVHVFNLQFIHDIQNFIIDFTKIKV